MSRVKPETFKTNDVFQSTKLAIASKDKQRFEMYDIDIVIPPLNAQLKTIYGVVHNPMSIKL